MLRRNPLIGGAWKVTSGDGEFKIVDPATMDVITTISSCAVSDVEKSIQCAHDAFKKWKLTSGHQRSSILRKWFSLIVKHRDDLANIVTAENGKPFAQALNEVDYAASFIEWNAEEAKRIDGKILSSASSKNRLLVLRQPVGVAAMVWLESGKCDSLLF